MLADLEAEAPGNGGLARLDSLFGEFLHAAAFQADDVIVMAALVQFEDSHAIFKVVARDEARRLELSQHAVDGRKPDVLIRLKEAAIDVFRRQVAGAAALENLQDLKPRQRDLETNFTKILAFHSRLPPEHAASRAVCSPCMISPIILHWTDMRLSQVPRISVRGLGAPLWACILVLLAGCVYRLPIQQGNFLEPRLVDKLEIGMTRAQVRYLLGTPMVPNTFDADRWDYLYYLKKGRVHKPVQRRLTVFFAADKVARVEKEGSEAAPKTEPLPGGRTGI